MLSAGPDWLRGDEEPLIASSEVHLHPWEEFALDRPTTFASDLDDMGLSQREVEEALSVRDQGLAEFHAAFENYMRQQPLNEDTPPGEDPYVTAAYESARRSATRRLSDWFAGRRVEVEERRLVEVKLPLFVLSAPDTDDSCVLLKAEETRTRTAGWSVAIAGTGLGDQATVETSVASTFKVDAGQTKAVFLPATVAIEKLRVSERGVPATRVDFTSVRDRGAVPGVLLLACDAIPAIGSYVRTFPLLGDTTGAITTYEWTYAQESAAELELGVKAFGVDVSISGKSKMKTALALSLQLRGGCDYPLHQLANGDGVLWQEPSCAS